MSEFSFYSGSLEQEIIYIASGPFDKLPSSDQFGKQLRDELSDLNGLYLVIFGLIAIGLFLRFL